MSERLTLIELIVVMILIGIFALIVIQVVLNLWKTAQNPTSEAEVSALGKADVTHCVDGNGVTAAACGAMAVAAFAVATP